MLVPVAAFCGDTIGTPRSFSALRKFVSDQPEADVHRASPGV